MKHHLLVLLTFAALPLDSLGQSPHPLFSQNFDSVSAPDLPPGWHANGFATAASVPRSAPNAAVATGNTRQHDLTSPACELAGRLPGVLVFHERRSSTAAGYRLEVSGSTDAFVSLAFCATFDSAPVLSSYVERSIDLASVAVGEQSGLQFRWRILADSTNTTGVLRIDDIVLTVRTPLDLAAERIEILPSDVTARDSLRINAHLRNLGEVTVSDYEVQFFVMPEGSQAVQPGDRFAVSPGPSLAAGDSAVVRAVHPPLRPGVYRALVAAVGGGDGEPANDTLTAQVRVGAAQHSVVVNEIMYAPQGDEPEWIELLNVTQDTLSLEGWSVSDHGLAKKVLTGPGPWALVPGQFAVVARDGSFPAIHPTVSCAFFMAEFSALNNTTPDGPLLYSDQGITIDSIRYDPSWSGGQVGRSLERTDSDGPSSLASTWMVCADSSGSTPGRQNSTARLACDLAVTSLEAVSRDASEFLIGITVTNVGKHPVTEHEVLLSDDRNGDRRGDEQELLAAHHSSLILNPGDSLRHEWSATIQLPGEHTVIGEVRSAADERPSNDRAFAVIRARHRQGVMVINEIMYEPFEGSCEWVELYNRSSEEIDIRLWELSDAPTAAGSVHRVRFDGQTRPVRPGEFVLVAADSTIGEAPYHLAQEAEGVHLILAGSSSDLGLANDGDAVIIKDLSGSTIDSMVYSPMMHHPALLDVRGRSLERIRPDGLTNDRANWSTATGPLGGSPGFRNTIVAEVVAGAAALAIQPNPFSPDHDGTEDFCIISVQLPFAAGLIRARVFDTRGRMVRTLANAEVFRAHMEIIWDGLDDRRGRLPVGPYVVLVEASDALTGARVVHKAVAVVATRL